MRIGFLMMGGALVLAACGDGGSEPNSTDEVLAEAEQLVKPRPGLYRNEASLTEFELPGVPEQQVSRMREMFVGMMEQPGEQCITQAQADEGYRSMVEQLAEGSQGVTCEFQSFDVDGGDLDADLQCSGPGGVDIAIGMAGQVAEEESSMRMTMQQSSAMLPGGEMRMVMSVESVRVGDCG